MEASNYLKGVLQNFYLLTNIPIQHYNYHEIITAQYGLNQALKDEISKYQIFEILERKYKNKNQDTITIEDDIHYTIAPVCPRNKYRGYFLFGPYTSNPNRKNIAYKPLKLKDNIKITLRLLWKNSPDLSEDNINDYSYSFHIKKAIDYIDSRYNGEFVIISDEMVR